MADPRPKAFRCPERGWVTYDRLDVDRATAWVISENATRIMSFNGCPEDEAYAEARRTHSPLEADLLAAFWFYGEDPVLQAPLGRFWADFYFPNEDLAVEVDGREWHEWTRDRKRDQEIYRTLGVSTKRFFGVEVWRDPMNCAQQTIRELTVIRKAKGRARAA